MQFYTENYITLYTHVTYIPVDILKHNRQGEGGRERETPGMPGP